ncbi:phosphonate metabolism transcriptional regulator PhnF [Rhizobium jaguaris]|uniref:Phosphonate metabolism transcriptional regulator PhnF n=1 Tax=Rhizobium jaguaris TaxID=1312183 RepID=A0A387FYJ5_9HYPH|nr:phosphonate metabolism transcriptional regulator PhnF [Rhizobium jaguaris]AYG63408.1 phosphonate metabolism transcriptional regulator PhnF [Rhizobium jaguaris]
MQKKLLHGQWRMVESDIAEDILAGRIAPQTQLPKETELMEKFGVGRHTVRRAISQLETRGLVRVEQGRGTFVQSRIDYRLSERTRFSQNLLDQGRETLGQPIHEEVIEAPTKIAEALRLPIGEPVYHIVRREFVDDKPISHSHSYFPVRRFPGFNDARRSGRSITSILADYGVPDYIRLRTDIVARLPTAEEARHLMQDPSLPVVALKKVDVDLKGMPVAYSESVWPGERVQFSIDNTSQLLDALARRSES